MGGVSTIRPGLKRPCGSNVRFQRPERLVELRAEHLFVERTAHEAVAVLAGQRAAEFEHEVGHLVGDRLELRHAVRGLEIDDRPHVQAADRRVRVDAGRGVMTLDDGDETLDVVAQLLRRDRGVFDERDRLRRRLSSPSTGPAPLRGSDQMRCCSAASLTCRQRQRKADAARSRSRRVELRRQLRPARSP